MSTTNKRSHRHRIVADTAIALLLVFALGTAHWILPQLLLPEGLSTWYLYTIFIIFMMMCIGAYWVIAGSFVEPKRIIITKKTIPLRIGDGVRIAIVGDFHVGVYNGADFVESIVDAVNALKPDLIFLMGDYIDDENADLNELKPLRALRAKRAIFAVMGNHDAGEYLTFWNHRHYSTVDRTDDVEKLLNSMGITTLRNTAHFMQFGEETLAIAGMDDVLMKDSSLEASLRGISKYTSVILLSHSPDVILDRASRVADLIVSGHTHGGQIRLPLIGPLLPLPDKAGRRYDRGMIPLTATCNLMVTQGVGVTGVRARLFCPPEVVLLETTGN